MRQTGILAASAAYALTYNFPQLKRVHGLAKKLEVGLEDIGAEIMSRAETCMVNLETSTGPHSAFSYSPNQVFYDPSSIGLDYGEIADRASALSEPLVLGGSRLVVHIQTTEAAVDDFLVVVRELAAEKKKAGFVRPEKSQQSNVIKDVYVRRTSGKPAH
jgi:threonine aldolase